MLDLIPGGYFYSAAAERDAVNAPRAKALEYFRPAAIESCAPKPARESVLSGKNVSDSKFAILLVR